MLGMKKKKAMAIQFNWIFVLFAGALIIVFFVFLIQGGKKNSENKLDANIATQLDSIMTSAQQSPGTAFSVKSPSVEINYDACAEESGGVFSIGDVSVIKKEPAFAPSVIKSAKQKLIIASQSFDMPFRATNMLYVTSPDVKYVFINDGADVAESFLASDKVTMPNGTTIELSVDCKTDDTNNYKIRYVYFDDIEDSTYVDCFDELDDNSDASLTAVVFSQGNTDNVIDDLSQLSSVGKVKFYVREGDEFFETGNSVFIGAESVLGAILSEDVQSYECTMKHAFGNLNRVASVVEDRREFLGSVTSTLSNNCKIIYGSTLLPTSIGDALSEIITLSGKASVPLAYSEIQSIYSNSRTIVNANKYLQLQSCPLLY